MFAAVTNRPCPTPDPDRRSRGCLVYDALAAGSAEAAVDQLDGLPEGAYNPFNCYVADSRRAFGVVYESRTRIEELRPGVHVIGNADPNDRGVAKVSRVMDRAEAVLERPSEPVLEGLGAICRAHEVGGNFRDDTCVHLGATYGTRSSALILLSEQVEDSQFWFAGGAPCVTPYRDFTSLLHEQSRSASYGAAGISLRKAN